MQKYFVCALKTEARNRDTSNDDKERDVSIILMFQIFQMRFSELLPGRWNSTEHKSVRDSFHHGLKAPSGLSAHHQSTLGTKEGSLFPPGSQAEAAQRSGLCHPRPARPALRSEAGRLPGAGSIGPVEAQSHRASRFCEQTQQPGLQGLRSRRDHPGDTVQVRWSRHH